MRLGSFSPAEYNQCSIVTSDVSRFKPSIHEFSSRWLCEIIKVLNTLYVFLKRRSKVTFRGQTKFILFTYKCASLKMKICVCFRDTCYCFLYDSGSQPGVPGPLDDRNKMLGGSKCDFRGWELECFWKYFFSKEARFVKATTQKNIIQPNYSSSRF